MAPLDVNAQEYVNKMWDRGTISTVDSYDIVVVSAGIQLSVRTDDDQVHSMRFRPRDALDIAIQMQQDVERTAQALQALLKKDPYQQ